MNEYIILTSTPSAYVSSQYRALVQVQMLGTDTVLNITHSANPTLPGDSLIAATNPFTGLPVEPTNEDLYLQIRPLGNDAGQATGPLGYHGWAGTPVRVLGDPDATYEPARLYPGTDIPFDAEIRHKYFDTPATPSSTGWGFRCEIVGGSSSRDPSVRSMGAYDDPEYTAALWPAIGAYQEGESDWQIDGDGNPLTVWYLDSWDGLRLAEKRTWYVVLLYASVWEGKAVLKDNEDSVTYLFWEKDQVHSEVLPWVQPAGAHDAYQIDDMVTHNGDTWISTAADNVWEPGVYGWVVVA